MPSQTLFNPLDEYASYSIHYIMLACRTTTESRDFVNESKNVETLANIEKVTKLGEPVPFEHPNSVYLVMDTRRFSQFTVESLKYDVLINGLEKPTGSPGNLSTKIIMTIIDSVGITFINFLQYLLQDVMKTNFDGMVFMLRIVFVGHKPDGTTETVQSVTIPIHLLKMEIDLDSAKGTYHCEFMPNVNFDANRNSRWLNVGNASNYFTGKNNNNTLGDMIRSFELELNKASKLFYDQANLIVDQAEIDQSQRNGKGRFGRQVEYMITLPNKTWEDYIYTGAASGAAEETVFKIIKNNEVKSAPAAPGTPAPKPGDSSKVKTETGSVKDTHLSVPNGSTIPQVLDIIFKQVFDVAKLGAGTGATGSTDNVKFFNYIVGVSSDEERFIVHVDVVEFLVPKSLYQDLDKNSQTISQNTNSFYVTDLKTGIRRPANYMEFDYLFSGKNKDVIKFDMKMQDLTYLLAANLNIGAGAFAGVTQNQNTADKGLKINKQAELVQARAYDALLLPKQSSDELSNFTNYASLLHQKQKEEAAAANPDNPIAPEVVTVNQKWTRNLSTYYAISPIIAVMTIKGNPNIMDKFNVGDFLPHISAFSGTAIGVTTGQIKTNTLRETYTQMLTEQILNNNVNESGSSRLKAGSGRSFTVDTLGNQSYTIAPVFVKVNILGPNVDFRTSELINGEKFSTDLLLDAYYVVHKISNSIEGNNFTQTIELFSHNIYGFGKRIVPAAPTPATPPKSK